MYNFYQEIALTKRIAFINKHSFNMTGNRRRDGAFHLHGTLDCANINEIGTEVVISDQEHTAYNVTLLYFLSFLDSHLNHHSGHGSSN
jgi:hypothetical protein